MTVEDLFIKGNKLFAETKFLEGLGVYKQIYLRFPKNFRLYEEIKPSTEEEYLECACATNIARGQIIREAGWAPDQEQRGLDF